MAGNSLLSASLEPAALSDPRNYRLVFMFFTNDTCDIAVQACYNVGAMTYNVNSDTTNVLCTNLYTGVDEPVAIIENGATKEVSMELSRYLPLSKRSELLRLAKLNCGLRIYLLRGNRCLNPLSVDEFDVLEIIGAVRFSSAYSRTELVHNAIGNSQEVSESTTITGYNLTEVAEQNWATRGGATTNPIIDIKICDTQVCGGLCDDDSDGCQVMFWVDDAGNVWYTLDQLETESLSGVLTTDPGVEDFVPGVVHSLCCVADQVVVVVEELDDATGLVTVGSLYIADVEDIVSGDIITWNKTQVSTLGVVTTNLPILNACQRDGQEMLWLVGEDGSVFQYNPTSGIVTLITAIPNITDDYYAISIQNERIIIGGENGIFITSADGGRSFQTVEVIDPATGLALAGTGIDITALDILLDEQWELGLSDGRIIYTVDAGDDWFNHILPSGMIGGAIKDIHYDTTLVGYAITEGGDVLKAYYGICRPYVLMPENNYSFPENNGLNSLAVCQYDPDVVVAAGESVAGAGFIALGTSETA